MLAGDTHTLVEEYPFLDGLPTDRTFVHAIAAHLTGSVAAHEDHVLQPVHAHGAAGLRR